MKKNQEMAPSNFLQIVFLLTLIHVQKFESKT